MADVQKINNGFHIKKDSRNIILESIAAKGKKPGRGDSDRIERCELMLELICSQLKIKME